MENKQQQLNIRFARIRFAKIRGEAYLSITDLIIALMEDKKKSPKEHTEYIESFIIRLTQMSK